MPEVREVFDMATQKVRPDPNALERQHRDQRQHVARRKATVFVLVGALALGGAALGLTIVREKRVTPASNPSVGATSTTPAPQLPGGALDPGRYVFTSYDPGLDASYRVSINVPEGYAGYEGWAAIKTGTSQTAVSTMAIGVIYADACHWQGTRLDRSQISSTAEVAAALANQRGLRVSAPRDVTVDGFAGTYMERKVPAGTNLAKCDDGQFRVYLDAGRGSAAGQRYLVPGELQQLWIVDVDGVPLVIDASMNPGMPAEIRAELRQMVESVRIEPRAES
jgi:hypothetical protein